MRKITFLGHDNASLSMLIESLFRLYNIDFSTEIITISKAEQIDSQKVPFLLNDIENNILFHEDWLPEIDSTIVLGTMVAGIKKKIYDFFEENYSMKHEQYAQIFHPTSVISESSTIGYGSSLGPGCILAPFSKLGNHVSVNRNATVGHHSVVSDFVTLNPACNIAGYCQIGQGVTIGMGANVIDGRKIGENTTIGAGSLVTKSIPPNVVAYGVPAKVVRDKN
jgi:sugar O-acyltransferase (sialic acid O-acetyltransferase NeuD family)